MKILRQADRRRSGFQPVDRGIYPAAKSRWIMPGVDVRERKGSGIQARQKDCDKGCEVNVVNIKAVDPFQNFGGGIGIRSHGPDGGLQTAHEHPGGDTVPTYIRNDQPMCAVPELEEIEIVAADDLRGTAEGSQLHTPDVGD